MFKKSFGNTPAAPTAFLVLPVYYNKYEKPITTMIVISSHLYTFTVFLKKHISMIKKDLLAVFALFSGRCKRLLCRVERVLN